MDQADEALLQQCRKNVNDLVAEIHKKSQDAANNGLIDKEKYVVPPHLHDLQEADLPETQRVLVVSEIAQFRERAAKREREKMRDNIRENPAIVTGAPSGPKVREWGKPQDQSRQQDSSQARGPQQGFGNGAQGYQQPVGFVKAQDNAGPNGVGSDQRALAGKTTKSDEELEAERKESRRREEETSFRDVGVTFQYEGRILTVSVYGS